MLSVTTTIVGITPLLQHRFGEADEVSGSTRRQMVVSEDPRTAAERVANRLPDGGLFIPGGAFARLLREAGGAHKARGSRKSLKFLVPSAVLIEAEVIPLLDVAGKPLREFEVDSRPVTIPATKGRIMRHRPRLNQWSAVFSLEIDPQELPEEVVHQLLQEGGNKIGVGDYRPEKGGPFGRFRVLKWTRVPAAKPAPVHKAAA